MPRRSKTHNPRHWKRFPDRRRDEAERAIYNAPEWRSFRSAWLASNPVCVQCGLPANEVDHIVPLAEGGGHLDPAKQSIALQILPFTKNQKPKP